MTELRPALDCPPLPPMRLDAATGLARAPRSVLLIRGLFVLAVLALPALGLQLAEPDLRGSRSEAMQAAAVPLAPRAGTAAAMPAR